jgi:hypothetical protein
MKLKAQNFKIALHPLFWVYAVIVRVFCNHDYLWVRNVYGDEIYMTGKFKRSWWKCNKCGKWQLREQLHTDGRS